MIITWVSANEELCVGCHLCELACSNYNFRSVNPKQSAVWIVEKKPEAEGFYVKICTQCGVCAEKCPERAIALVNGVYVIDIERCTKCGVCIEVCPFEAIWWRPGLEYPVKCVSCRACIEMCPRGVFNLKEREVKVV